MRYPVGNTGSKEEFNRDWYIAQGFGNPTSYGFHEGLDINLRTGGDTDLNKELKAIAKGIVTYYHYASHPTTNFGRHLVYEIVGAWGRRWVHYAHCTDQDFVNIVKEVSEGQIVARLGKSGTTAAHLHMSIFKVNPKDLTNGIDSIAKTKEQLDAWWEDPITFINKWIGVPTPTPTPTPDPNLPISDPKAKLDFQGMQTEIEKYDVLEFELVKAKIIAKDKDIVIKANRIKELEQVVPAPIYTNPKAILHSKLANEFEAE